MRFKQAGNRTACSSRARRVVIGSDSGRVSACGNRNRNDVAVHAGALVGDIADDEPEWHGIARGDRPVGSRYRARAAQIEAFVANRDRIGDEPLARPQTELPGIGLGYTDVIFARAFDAKL